MNKKALFIGGGALAVVAIVVALILIFTGGSDEYRSIKVFEMDGKCTVTRGSDTLDAFKNMALSSGDTFEVPGTGFARLKLDEDKFVYLEAGTKIELFATGNEKDSKTRVFIERGSMMTEVKRKLSATSSYDIVTPNTTMSIRGTKTLTQVIEDAVTGHVKTSNAVLEGQVKIKAVKVKADGTVVSVEKDLGAGEGNSFSSTKEELVSQEEMKSIADTGSTESGIKVEIVSEEEAEVVFDVAVFQESFMQNIKEILIADAQAEAGEEGLTQEQIDSINDTLNLVLESFDTIQEVSQQAIYDATYNSANDQPVYSDNTNPSDNDQTAADDDTTDTDGVNVDTDDTAGTDDGTETVTGEESLINADDLDTGEDDGDEADGADADTGDEEDDTDEAGEGDEEDDSDEADEDGEEDEADDEDKSDEEESDEEDKSDDDKSDEEDEDKEDESDENKEDETEQEEPSEQQEEQPVVNPSEDEGQGGGTTEEGGSSEGSSSETTSSVSYADSHWSYELSTSTSGSPSEAAQRKEWRVDISYINKQNRQTVSYNSLPTTQNTILPGVSGSEYDVKLTVTGDCPPDKDYVFTGWYATSALADTGNESDRITTITGSTGTLYPGIKEIEKTFTVSFVNLFPEAGKLVVPAQNYWGNYQYEVVDSEANNRINITGIPYDGVIYLPDVEDHMRQGAIKEKYLHIEGAYGPEDELGPYFAGVGVAYSGNSDSLTYSSNINLTRILLDDELYISSVGSDFISYGEEDREAYQAETHIRSDMTFYLYFSIPVKLEVSDLYQSSVGTYGKMMDVHGDMALIENAVKTYPGYDNEGSFDDGQLIRLRGGNNNQSADQYWMVSKAFDTNNSDEVTWYFDSHYYGKPLEIPAFFHNQPRLAYQSSYSVCMKDGTAINGVTYMNDVAAGTFTALTLNGAGSTSFPYNKYKQSDGSLSINSMSFELENTMYAFLDLSESGITVNLGEMYGNVIRTSTESSKMYKVKLYEEHLPSFETDCAFVPEDGLYDWGSGGIAWNSERLEHVEQDRFMISKPGYRLAGYVISAENWDGTSVANPEYHTYVNDMYGNNVFFDDTDGIVVSLARVNDLGKKLVVKPVFAPVEQPFKIELERDPEYVFRTDDNFYLLSYTPTEPDAPDGTPFVTEIDFSSIRLIGYNWTSVAQGGQYVDGGYLGGRLVWNPDSHKYFFYNGNGQLMGLTTGYNLYNGKIRLSLKFFTGVENVQFIRGIKIEDDTETSEDESIIQYKTSITGTMDCGMSASEPGAESFEDYVPWARHIELDQNAPYEFTAVYIKYKEDNETKFKPTAIFSEVKDELPAESGEFLRKIAQETSLKDVWYGGKIEAKAYHSECFVVEERQDGTIYYEIADIFPWSITRFSTGGNASRAIQGNLASYPKSQKKHKDANNLEYAYGSGVLFFEKYKYISIKDLYGDVGHYWENSDVRIYKDLCKDKLSDDAIDTSGLTDYTYTVSEFVGLGNEAPELYFELDLTSDNYETPKGWARVTSGSNVGYIYYGTANVPGKIPVIAYEFHVNGNTT